MSTLRCCALSLALLIAAVRPAPGATIRVPEDYPTVLADVDAASPGDCVLVGPGTWTASATRVVVIYGLPRTVTACAFPRGGVTILGTAGRDATILDASAEDTGAGSLVVIELAEQVGQGPVTLDGLTLTGARRPGGAQAVSAVEADGVCPGRCASSDRRQIRHHLVGVRRRGTSELRDLRRLRRVP